MASVRDLRPISRPATAGAAPDPAGRLPHTLAAVALLVVAAATLALVAQLAGSRSALPAPTVPAFLTDALGAPQSAAPLVREPATGVRVALTRDGYAVRAGGHGLALSGGGDGGRWTRHAGGVTRSTAFGAETITVTPRRVEQFLTVTERQGARTWRWRLDTPLVPHLDGGWIRFTDRSGAPSRLRIRPVAILDAAGRTVTPDGLSWSLVRDGGATWLTLDLDDRDLPLPYVIDPAADYPAPLYFASTDGPVTGTTDWTLVTAAPSTANTTTAVRFAQGATGYLQFNPGTLNAGTPAAPATSPNANGWIVNAAGGTGFPAGNWSFTIRTTHGGQTSGVPVMTVAVWKGTLSGGTFTCTSPCATSVSSGGGTVIAPTDDPTGTDMNNASPTTTTFTVAAPKFRLGTNETLWVQVWQHMTSAYTGGNDNARRVFLNVNNGITLVSPTPADDVAPTHSLSVTAVTNSGGQFFDSTNRRLYYNPAAAGSFTVTDALSDAGSGPFSVAFPAVSGTPAGSFEHASVTDTSAPFTSNTYAWTTANTAAPSAQTITGEDLATNTATTTLNFVRDVSAPTGGALTVNGTAASAAGTTTYSTSGSFPIDTRTDYTEAMDATGSGLASSTLVRETATLTNDVCGSFASATTISGNPSQGPLADGCYRYTLTGTDRVGNTVSVRTTVKVDTTNPTNSVSLLLGSGGAHLSGTTIFYRGSAAGSFQLRNAVSDSASGPASSATALVAAGSGWTHTASTVSTPTGGPYDSNPFGWGAGTTSSPQYRVTGADRAGGTAQTTYTFTNDIAGPTVTAPTVTPGYYTSLSVPVTLNGGSDGSGSGVDAGSSVVERDEVDLTNGTCGTFADTWTTLTLSGGNDTTVANGKCYRYRQKLSDNVGNQGTSTASATARVDTTAPAAPTLAFGSFTAASESGGTVWYRPGASIASFTVTASATDAESGIASWSFPAAAGGWSVSGSGGTRTYSHSGSPSNPPDPQQVTVTNGAGAPSPAAEYALEPDATPPSVTAPTVTGGYHTSLSIPVTLNGGSDAGSSVLERDEAELADGDCGTFADDWTTVTLSGGNDTTVASGKCYRYRQKLTDNVGNEGTSGASAVARVDTTAPAAPLLAFGAFTNASATGTTVYVRPGTSGGFTVTATASDAQSGIGHVAFPSFGGDWTGGGNDTTHPYTSAYAFTATDSAPAGPQDVVARNNADADSAAATFTVVEDGDDPTGGALTVNGTGATAGGSSSYSTTGSFTIGVRDEWSDDGSGLASSVLTREDGTLAGDSCSGYAGPVEVTGAPDQDGLASGCYRYTLTGTDKVGNTVSVTTTVKVDTSPPAAPTLSFANPSGDVHYPGSGSLVWYRGAAGASGSFEVTPSSTDAETDVSGYAFTGALGGFGRSASGATRTYSYTGAAAAPAQQDVTASNNAGATSTATSFTVANDTTPPSGGALTVNGTAATGGAGSQSYDTDGEFEVDLRTNYGDDDSGLASSVLVREYAAMTDGACGTFGSATIVSGSPTQTGLDTGCYRYTLTGTDNVGNTASVATTVMVDEAVPVSAASALPAYHAGTSITVEYTASDSGTGVAAVELWVRRPGDAGYALAATDVTPETPSFSYVADAGDGTYLFYTRAKDKADNHEAAPGSADTSTVVDTQKPSSSASALPQYRTATTFTVAYSRSDATSGVQEVELWVKRPGDSDYVLAATDDDPATPSFEYEADAGDGVYLFYTRARDNAGNPEDAPAEADASTTLDTTKPSSAPGALPAYRTSATFSVSFSATDATSGVKEVELWVDGPGAGGWTHALTEQGASGSFSFTAGEGNGTYAFYTRARDEAGNFEDAPGAAQTTTVLDTTPPTTPTLAFGSFTNAVEGGGTTVFFRPGVAGGFTVVPTSSDPESDVAGYTYPDLGTGWGNTNGSYTFADDAADPEEPLAITATNGAGVASAAATFTVTPDGAAPTTTATCDTGTCAGWFTSSPVTVELSADDGLGSGVAQVRYTTDGSDPSPINGTVYTLPFSVAATTTVKFRAYDRLGNEEPVATVLVRVDTTAPAAPSLAFGGFDAAVEDGGTVWYRPGAGAGSFTVTATATDAESGIDTVTFPAAAAGWTRTLDGDDATYAHTGSPSDPADPQQVVATNNAGLPSP
ncbi:MAG TPA: chitobiase/beta-hexosaminidase C-terminal domain-containing protein, partial [Gaiellaceae bacterium]|nr:chitobiase/beta-hexosaminidase C-terminal domain-containing protein [Gaiellaceae bacterium]